MDQSAPAKAKADAAASELRDVARAAGAGPHDKLDMLKVLDRIAAALAALDDGAPPKRSPRATHRQEVASGRPRLRHNWG